MIIATPPSLSVCLAVSQGLLCELVKLVSQSPNPEDLEAREFYLGASTSEYGTPWETWRAVRFFSLSLFLSGSLLFFTSVPMSATYTNNRKLADGQSVLSAWAWPGSSLCSPSND